MNLYFQGMSLTGYRYHTLTKAMKSAGRNEVLTTNKLAYNKTYKLNYLNYSATSFDNKASTSTAKKIITENPDTYEPQEAILLNT